jgi:hypothetical protein
MLATTNPIPKVWETLNDARLRIKEKIHFRRPNIRRKPALSWQGGNDYALKEGQNNCWVQIDNHSVYIRRTSQGIAVEIIDHKEGGELDTVAETGITVW